MALPPGIKINTYIKNTELTDGWGFKSENLAQRTDIVHSQTSDKNVIVQTFILNEKFLNQEILVWGQIQDPRSVICN